MREYKAKITDGGNAHLQAFVRPYTLGNASKSSFYDKTTIQEMPMGIKFSVRDFLKLKDSALCSRAFSTRCLTRIPATPAVPQAPAATYEHNMAQYRAM